MPAPRSLGPPRRWPRPAETRRERGGAAGRRRRRRGPLPTTPRHERLHRGQEAKARGSFPLHLAADRRLGLRLPLVMDNAELWALFAPGLAGAVFGAGWWFWVDAVVCSAVQVSFLHYLPGIFASLAAIMFNCVKREDIDYSPYDDGEWRIKLWLFLAYVVSFVSLAAAVGLLVQDALTTKGPSAWTGTAGVLQCVFVLISGLIFWTSHTE